MRINYRIKFIIILLALISAEVCQSSEGSGSLISVKAISGIEKITDSNFKRDLSMFLTLSEKFDYINKYFYLSKDYLKKNFPDITNEKEYDTNMTNTSEIGYISFIKILNVKRVSKEQYKVILLTKSKDEGFDILLKEIYYFVYEDNRWKFNDIEVLEYLEEKESIQKK